MAPITASTEVNQRVEEVFAYATDPARFHEWQKGVIGGRVDQAGTPAIGTRCVNTRRIGFANRPVTSEITQIDPPRTWGIRGVNGPIRAAVDVSVERVADSRSRLTITLDFEGYGIGKVLVHLVVIPQARKEMPVNLAALKARLESDRR
ncbi:MAG: SRPBCC family protein [Acidimicrobiales bacterium]